MTEQDAKHIGEIFAAAALGQKIEYKSLRSGNWMEQCPWGQGSSLRNYPNNWRIKPKPKTRPWEAEDVPVMCWIRGRAGSGVNDVQRLVICVQEGMGVTFAPGVGRDFTSFKELSKHWEYSTDRKNWSKCEIQEDQP